MTVMAEKRIGVVWPGETKVRKFRCSDPLWDAARVKAAKEGTTVSDVLRDLLAGWVGDPDVPLTNESKHDPRGRA